MNKLMTTGTLGLAGLVTTGLIAWQAPLALADEGRDDRGRDDRFTAVKRDDDAAAVITTVDDDDDDDTGLGHGTQTRTRGGDDVADTNTGTRTRGGVTDHSRSGSVRDLTSDGPGSGNVDHSRHHTNDGTRHNTRG
ncbi:hypothetical protein [Nocardioides sp.]|uniref:hypothetical protein n=1 Tax=Nocardioides sp. TaxID=35761 RepID=UPI0025E8E99A|nr:hypothetical protein [Nocardioides sp.]